MATATQPEPLRISCDRRVETLACGSFAERVGALLPGQVDDVRAAREMLLEK